jgi:hypothetical protein
MNNLLSIGYAYLFWVYNINNERKTLLQRKVKYINIGASENQWKMI